MNDYERNDPYINLKGELVYPRKTSLLDYGLLSSFWCLDMIMGSEKEEPYHIVSMDDPNEIIPLVGKIEYEYFISLWTQLFKPHHLEEYIKMIEAYGVGMEEDFDTDGFTEACMEFIDKLVTEAEHNEFLYRVLQCLKQWFESNDEKLRA